MYKTTNTLSIEFKIQSYAFNGTSCEQLASSDAINYLEFI